MKIFRGVAAVPEKYRGSILAVGVFDGLHLGHQELIRKAVSRARTLKTLAVVLTFDPHPVHVLRPENHLPLIISLPYRLKLIRAMGVDAVVLITFTRKFAGLTPEQFIKRYLLKPFHPRAVIVGDDFRFGQNRKGTIELFKAAGKRAGFKVLSVRTRQNGKKKFSSTLARDLIAKGALKDASRILGRPVAIMGKVVAGDRRGRTLGYPTVNITPSVEILPPQGVYAVRVLFEKERYNGMANIGMRPSFHKQGGLNVEAHIFDFNKKIYGAEIVIEFLHKVRNELYFPSSRDLVAQLRKDEAYCRKWFARHKHS